MGNIELIGEWKQLEFVITQKDTSAVPYGPVQNGDVTIMVCEKGESETAAKAVEERARKYVLDQMQYFNQGFNLWVTRLNAVKGTNNRCYGCEYSETCTVRK